MQFLELSFKKWRQLKGYTQKQAAALLGTTHVSISHLENNRNPTIKGRRVLEIFNLTKGIVTPNMIFGITQEKLEEMAKLREKDGEHNHLTKKLR